MVGIGLLLPKLHDCINSMYELNIHSIVSRQTKQFNIIYICNKLICYER